MKFFRFVGPAMLALVLSACASTVQFTSSPPGATVVYDGKPIGVTPFKAEIRDRFGWHSVYSFAAHKECHWPMTLSVQETNPLDHNNILPPVFHFELLPAACLKSSGLMLESTVAGRCFTFNCGKPIRGKVEDPVESQPVALATRPKCPGDPRCTIQKYGLTFEQKLEAATL